MQPWENIKSHKVISGMSWKHRTAKKQDNDCYVSSRYRKASRRNQQHAFAASLTDKDHLQATTFKPIYLGRPVICNFCSHSAKPVWCRNVVQGADVVRTESFFFVSVDFLIHFEQYENTCMAVLIRRVTCESLFSFWGPRKVLSCKIYLRGLRPCFFHGRSERLSFFELRPSQQPF